jgi:TATA-binding protein-associated factor
MMPNIPSECCDPNILYDDSDAVHAVVNVPEIKAARTSTRTAKVVQAKTLLSKVSSGKSRKIETISTSPDAYDDSSERTDVHRCLIFAQHMKVLDLIESSVLRKYFPSVEYRRLDGSVDASTRGKVAEEFNAQQEQQCHSTKDNTLIINKLISKKSEAKKDIRILLLTPRSCGLGLNLSAADTVIFVQHDWNPYVDLQVRPSHILYAFIFCLLYVYVIW